MIAVVVFGICHCLNMLCRRSAAERHRASVEVNMPRKNTHNILCAVAAVAVADAVTVAVAVVVFVIAFDLLIDE